MAAPARALLRGISLSRLQLQNPHRFATRVLTPFRRSWCSTDAHTRLEEELLEKTSVASSLPESPKSLSWDRPSYGNWRYTELRISIDIEVTIILTKKILHSSRYKDGEQLSAEDEAFVVEKLLFYHPNALGKVGCGLDSIKVDRHPEFRQSRCLHVIRTDGESIDFSYWKCLRGYIRQKYPDHAERYISRNVKRGGERPTNSDDAERYSSGQPKNPDLLH